MNPIREDLIIDYLPAPFDAVIVQCPGFSCCAVIDKRGIWRNNFTRKVLEGPVLGWRPIDEPPSASPLISLRNPFLRS